METPQIIAVVNFKGGTGKTTSSAYIAHAAREYGKRVLMVDADSTRKRGSLSKWAELAKWDIPTERLASPTLHRQLPGIIGRKYDVVVIDTPPLEQEAGVVHSALRAASTIVLPISPSLMEVTEIPDLLDAVKASEKFRDGKHTVHILLNRTTVNALSTGRMRRKLKQLPGVNVLTTEIRRREAIMSAFGRPIGSNLQGYYSATGEILEDQ